MKVHEKIKEKRKSKGITQTFVAEQVGMTTANYNMKENGKRVITVEELEKIASALKEPTAIFFDENINVELNPSEDQVKEVI